MSDRERRIEAGLGFLERCPREDDLNAAVADFLGVMRLFGFNAGACGAWVGVGKNRIHRFFFVDWPASWLELYAAENFFERDPLVIEARRRMAPFVWADIVRDRDQKEYGMDVYGAAVAHGWIDGYAVPIHGPGGYQGVVSLASPTPLDLSAGELGVLHAMCVQVHDRCRAAAGFGVMLPPQVKLTRREIECLQWVAVGKSDREIGEILRVSAATAHFHVEKAKKKLGVESRLQAVALSVLIGLI